MSKIKECEKFEEFKAEMSRLVDSMEKDAEKFYNKENKAAGVRLRKSFKDIRGYVQTKLNEASPKNLK